MMQLAALTRVMLGHVKQLPSEVNGGVYLFEGGGWYLLWDGPELCQWSRVQTCLGLCHWEGPTLLTFHL